MSTDLVKAAGEKGLMAFTDAADVFAHEAAMMGVQNGAYIAFSGKVGKWTIKGQDVDDGTCLAFNILHCQKGWRAWKNNKPVEQIWTPFVGGEPLPKKEELTDHWPAGKENVTDGWQEVIKIDVRDLEGGPQMDLTLPSEAPWRPVWRLIKEFGETAKLHRDEQGNYKIPIVEIGTTKVNGKSGSFYAPTFKIVDWVSEADMAERVQEYIEANGETETADTSSKTVVVEPVAVPQSAKPAVKMGQRK